MLTTKTIAAIAARYDLEPSDKLVIDSVAQANENHGEPHFVAGKLSVSWGTDMRGYYDAANLLDGYLAEETRCMRCDARAYREFTHNAYGE